MPDPTTTEQRLQRLERSLRYTQVVAVVLLLGLAAVLAHGFYTAARLRRSTFTDALTVPSQFWLVDRFVSVATDGSTYGLTIGGLRDNAQLRLEQAPSGEAHLVFYDQRGKPRLHLGIDAAGEPIVKALDASGAVRGVLTAPAH